MENSDLKVKTKSLSQIVKSLEEQRSQSSSITSLFSENTTALRKKLVGLIESILLEDFENVGKKTRDILWRKVYYDPISTSKKIWKKREIDLCDAEIILLSNFIKDGINHYKTLILKFEDNFSLDIRYIIDFGIIANGSSAFEKKSEKELYTVNETNHAIETIHNFLISLGDLHRYCIEFKFHEKDTLIGCEKQLAANYYYEAFKLNPKLGMPHNQLGTLLSGENCEISSIFHYLYSLCSVQPVELSETNVSKIFQHNNEALENSLPPDTDGFNIKDFMMQVILLIDILFYDKDVSEFNSICCSVLMSFRDYLHKCRRNSQADATFELTSIFMLCLYKLKAKNSQKVHSLNAFMVAFCSKIVETAIERIEDYIADHKTENMDFCDVYNRKFHDFDRKIKRARDMHKGKLPASKHVRENTKDSGIEKNGSSNSQKDSGSNHLSQLSEASQPGQVKIVKRPSIHDAKSNNTNNNNRRRRKRRGMSESTSENDSETESLASDQDDISSDAESMNSNFDSYDEFDDIRFSSDCDDEDDLSENGFENHMPHESDGEDIVIENEEIVYKNSNEPQPLKFHDENGLEEDIVIEDEQIIFREENDTESIDSDVLKLLKMKYKKKYTKVDPNLILKFSEEYASWMQSLKILFDWLHINNEIMLGCYRSNPEFINSKIIKLINLLNIDIFTRKIYFDRSMLKMKNVRENLRYLFDTRHQIATSEDVIFKKFPLFEEIQQPIDWNLNYKLQITPEEDIIMRNFKIVDFGFNLCKTKNYGHNFCARSRIFIERKRRSRRGEHRNRRNREDKRERRGRRERRRNRGRRDRRRKQSDSERFERLSIKTHSQPSQEVEEYPSLEQSHQINRKGYLRNKVSNEQENKISENEKVEMMGKLGKLWLKNEVQTLESRSRPANQNLTPYLMLDTKSLADYLNIVKNLVKSKKLVVLIPKAVLQDLDGLKKTKEGARNAIKWLESEFQKGNRFMRAQRESEYLQMPLLKVPSKLERDDAVFMNIVPFANFIVSNQSAANDGSDMPVLTLLTGDNLDSDRKRNDSTPSCINRAGILQSIPVKYDQIVRFYSKYKK